MNIKIIMVATWEVNNCKPEVLINCIFGVLNIAYAPELKLTRHHLLVDGQKLGRLKLVVNKLGYRCESKYLAMLACMFVAVHVPYP